jgi:hypothetical protein
MTIDADAQDASPVTLAAARAEFDADVTYLDTATFGLPPRRSWAALQRGAGVPLMGPADQGSASPLIGPAAARQAGPGEPSTLRPSTRHPSDPQVVRPERR